MNLNNLKHFIISHQGDYIGIIDKEIEFFRQDLSDSNAGEVINLLAESICKFLKFPQNKYKNNPIDYVFKKDLDFKDRKFIAVCFLRVFAYHKSIFGGGSFYFKSIDLFDEVFKKLYSKLDIDIKKDETFAKLSKLLSLVRGMESEISSSISSLDSLRATETFKNNYKKIINQKPEYRFILEEFVPREYLDIRIDEVFNILSNFLEAGKDKFFYIYNETINALNDYIKQAEKINTYYVEKFFIGLINKLNKLIQEEFKRNPICQPADIKIEKSEKKYPFNHAKELINLDFIVRNIGTGHAFDITIEIEGATDLKVKEKSRFLSYLEPNYTIIEFPAIIKKECTDVMITGKCTWRDYTKKIPNESTFEFILDGQPNLDWKSIEKEKPEPYSLKPIIKEENLIGRKEELRQLRAHSKSRDGVGSHVISGQRRVGKTSLVQVLKNILDKEEDKDFKVIYTRSGHYVIAEDPKETLNSLIINIYKELIKDDRFKSLNPPELKGSFSTISSFLREIINIVPNYRILFILDDFDYLPLKLSHPGEISESFFNTFKALSSDENFGFILVGGERMDYIRNIHGDKINLFKWRPVDYFNKEKWDDYRELVVSPVSDYKFEFSEDSVFCLYDYTAGNPFFTNLICQNLFSIMLDRRDCHITRKEIELAIKETISLEKGLSFSQFWEDGILSNNIETKIKIMNSRKKFLIAFSKSLRQSNSPDKSLLLEKGNELGGINIDNEVEELIRRNILLEQKNSDPETTYIFRVLLFNLWLKEKGPIELCDAFDNQTVIYKSLIKDEEERITSKEILELAEQWGSYKDQKITEDRIRAWLDQFSNNYQQRLMFKILKNLKFYKVSSIREKMVEAYDIVKMKLKEKGTWKKNEILVSYVGEYGKSSSKYAHLFRDQNNIYYKNMIEYSKIKELLGNKTDIKAIVFIDDFIGTGDQAYEYLNKINKELGETFNKSDLLIFYIVISGFQEALEEIDNLLSGFEFNLNFHMLDILEEKDKCFNENSSIFPNVTEKQHAYKLVEDIGLELVKDAPLGYKNCQALVVFSESCPNNSLPILWQNSVKWKPLFPRILR